MNCSLFRARHIAILVASLTTILPAFASPVSLPIDLSNNSDTSLHLVPSEAPTPLLDAYVTNADTQPSGTGVFKPFLRLSEHGIESAYNAQPGIYLDQLSPPWNYTLKFGDLEQFNLAGKTGKFVAFELDANEPGADKSLISIDNIRIYTSPTDTTSSVQNNELALDSLGQLRWAMNDPLFRPNGDYNMNPWILLDAAQPGSNGGSGTSDMILYVPVAAFGNAAANDYVWFYNLNGVHMESDKDLASQAGFEEWRAFVKTTNIPDDHNIVPDGGTTALLLGLGILAVGALARSVHRKTA